MKPELDRLLAKLSRNHIELAASLGLNAREVKGVCEELGYPCKASVLGDLLEIYPERTRQEAGRLGYRSTSELYTLDQGLELAQMLHKHVSRGDRAFVVRIMHGQKLRGFEVWAKGLSIEEALEGFERVTKEDARARDYKPITYGYRESEAFALRDELQRQRQAGRGPVVTLSGVKETLAEVWVHKSEKACDRNYAHTVQEKIRIGKGGRPMEKVTQKDKEIK